MADELAGAASIHPWNLTPVEAIGVQRDLAAKVIRVDQFAPINRVAGVDVGFEENGAVTRAAVAVLDFPQLSLREHVVARLPTTFPYVPGLLSFREIPAILAAFGQLQLLPDLILCDGQGLAHPRRFGIACHLGVWLDRPTIGVAKKRLCGSHDEVPNTRGASVPLIEKEETIGAVLRTRPGVKPLYVSLGHRVSLPTALRFVMACVTRYRLPETTRHAHHFASEVKEEA